MNLSVLYSGDPWHPGQAAFHSWLILMDNFLWVGWSVVEQTLALVIVFFYKKILSLLNWSWFFPHLLEKIVSTDNHTLEKTTKHFEGPNIECLITLELHKILEVDMCKRDNFKSKGIKRMQPPVFKNWSSLSELMENNGDGDVSWYEESGTKDWMRSW